MGTLLRKDALGISFYPVLKEHSFDYRGPENKLNDESGNDYRGENFLGPPPRKSDLKEFMFGKYA
jgi:hypothetical protein